MGDLFDLTELRIRQPGKVLPARATYEFFDTRRNLIAIARETQGRSRFEALANEVPSVRSLDVTTAQQQPVLTLVMRDLDWLARLTSPDGKLIGRIRVGETKRYYTLLDDEDKVAGEVSGDLSATKFAISGPAGERYAQLRKIWAGLGKELLTEADHYAITFTGQVPPRVRPMIVMVPIVLDMARHGPY